VRPLSLSERMLLTECQGAWRAFRRWCGCISTGKRQSSQRSSTRRQDQETRQSEAVSVGLCLAKTLRVRRINNFEANLRGAFLAMIT
jgi:hypothetical protein